MTRSQSWHSDAPTLRRRRGILERGVSVSVSVSASFAPFPDCCVCAAPRLLTLCLFFAVLFRRSDAELKHNILFGPGRRNVDFLSFFFPLICSDAAFRDCGHRARLRRTLEGVLKRQYDCTTTPQYDSSRSVPCDDDCSEPNRTALKN